VDQVLAAAVASTRPGGTCVNVSIWGHPATFDVNSLVFSEISLIGSLAYANRHEEVIELIRSGTVDVDQFITGRIGLDDIVDQGFRELIDHKESNVKILVHP
jgi:(R,R)-butanediol dehydrogenase/meso-butanediol dehydrogenase/diacetyl reductase